MTFMQAVVFEPLHDGLESNDPLSAVTEWGATLLSVQVTESPTAIVTELGENVLLSLGIATPWSAAVAGTTRKANQPTTATSATRRNQRTVRT